MDNEGQKERIVETALEMFNSRGCRGVTMDDIAQSMHISKRTLYETFANKEELLVECLALVRAQTDEMHRQAHRRVDEPLLVAMYMLHTNALFIHKYHRLMEEVKRYYPEIHEHFLARHQDSFRAVMEKGMAYVRDRGYLRADADTGLAMDFFCDLMEKHHPAADTDSDRYAHRIQEVCYTFLRGLMTTETLARYDSEEAHFRDIIHDLSDNSD